MRCETGTPKILIIPQLRVLVLTKRHVGSGNEIGLVKARALDFCHRPEGSWALGTRMTLDTGTISFCRQCLRADLKTRGPWEQVKYFLTFLKVSKWKQRILHGGEIGILSSSERNERVRLFLPRENVKFISSSYRVMFFLLY